MSEATIQWTAANPEWFCWFVNQGLFPLYEVKKHLEVFGTKILPQYKY